MRCVAALVTIMLAVLLAAPALAAQIARIYRGCAHRATVSGPY